MATIRTRAHALTLLLAAAALSACGGSKKPAAAPSDTSTADAKSGPAEVGKPAPDLTLQTLDGKPSPITMSSLAGKVVIVDFWATWCAPCRASFPKLEEIAKSNKGDVEVIGVSADEEVEKVGPFVKEIGATFQIGLDKDHTTANRWVVPKMPTTFIVDRAGTVRHVHAGYDGSGEGDAIAKEVASLVSEEKGKSATAVAKTDAPADTASSLTASAGSAASSATTSASSAASSASDSASAAAPSGLEAAAAAPPPKAGKKGAKPKPPAKKGAGKKQPKKK